MTELIEEAEDTPLAILTELINASHGEFERSVTTVLDTSCLGTGVEQILDTHTLIHEKLQAFAGDEKDSLSALSQLRADDIDRLPICGALNADEADQSQHMPMERLVIHLVDLRIAAGKLGRGIEHNRAAMVECFATTAVANLAQDRAPSMVSATLSYRPIWWQRD